MFEFTLVKSENQLSSDDLEFPEASGSQEFSPSGSPWSEDFDSIDEKSSSGIDQGDSGSDSQSDSQLGTDEPMETDSETLAPVLSLGDLNVTQSALVNENEDGLLGVLRETNLLLQTPKWGASESDALLQSLQACGWSLDQCNTWLNSSSTADIARAVQLLTDVERDSAHIAMGASAGAALIAPWLWLLLDTGTFDHLIGTTAMVCASNIQEVRPFPVKTGSSVIWLTHKCDFHLGDGVLNDCFVNPHSDLTLISMGRLALSENWGFRLDCHGMCITPPCGITQSTGKEMWKI